MVAIHKTTVVPYSADEMYALVNNIEAYPEFLAWCKSAQVRNRSETHLQATVAAEVGKIKQSFSTENTMQPGRRITMQLVEGPFRFLNGCWQFEPSGEQSCQVRLDIEFEFKNKLLKMALGHTFNHIMDTLVDAFTRRAQAIYGKR